MATAGQRDYHLHTACSPDSVAPMAAQCEAAVAAGLVEVAFTEHAEWVSGGRRPDDPAVGYFQPDAYFDEVARCRARFGPTLTIRSGVEVGSPHRCASELAQLLARHPYDVVLGSVHMVHGRSMTRPGSLDGAAERDVYPGYFDELLALARDGDYDVIGHFDICKRHGTRVFGPFEPERYGGVIRDTLRAVVTRGRGIEINCAGLRHPCGETYPGLRILEWYRELGGELLTLGSDAHRPEHVGFGLAQGAALAERAGFRCLTVFDRRTPSQRGIAQR